jgi:hypothetical protein
MTRTTWFLAVCAMTCLVSDLSAQGAATRIDPVAVQRDIASNPDFDVASLWRSLGIPARLDTVYPKLGMEGFNPNPNATFERCSGICEAEITRANLDADEPEELVLRVCRRWELCRFLIFKPIRVSPGPEQWRFLSYADHAFPNDLPKYRVELLGGRRYFVMSARGASGTGLSLYYDRWYEVGPTNTHEVLSLPKDGHSCPSARSLCREFRSTVASGTNGPQGDQVVANFTVRYWGDYFLLDETRYGEIPLFARTQRAVYARPKGSDDYALVAQRSDITAGEIRTVYGQSDALSCRDVLRFNADSLAQIASGRKASAKAWLVRYLAQCEPSQERTRLLGVLTR